MGERCLDSFDDKSYVFLDLAWRLERSSGLDLYR